MPDSNGNKTKSEKIKDGLYTGYLIVGIIAFSLGAYISWKRLKNSN